MNLTLYRIAGKFTKSFANDDDMFQYVEMMTDEGKRQKVERWSLGDWFDYNYDQQIWVYNPNASKETVPHSKSK